MARKQNYSYERFQRQTAKAAKRELKRETRGTKGALSADGAALSDEPAGVALDVTSEEVLDAPSVVVSADASARES